jgi:hypothetical protein
MSPLRETQSWFRSSTFLDPRIVISALLAGLLLGVCGVGLDRLVHHASKIYASDLYTCVVASVLSYLLLIYEKPSRMILARGKAIAAEVDHHIRNALAAIVYSHQPFTTGEVEKPVRPRFLSMPSALKPRDFAIWKPGHCTFAVGHY